MRSTRIISMLTAAAAAAALCNGLLFGKQHQGIFVAAFVPRQKNAFHRMEQTNAGAKSGSFFVQEKLQLFASDLSSSPETEPPAPELPLQLMSQYPPLWVTTQPILTAQECHCLSRHFTTIFGSTTDDATTIDDTKETTNQLLRSLRTRLDRLTCGATDVAPHVTPRFLSYEPEEDNDVLNCAEALVPDGLHVDTSDDGGENNSRRFLTALVYLTNHNNSHSSAAGATNFPLAVPLGMELEEDNNHPAALQAAQALLNAGVSHTHDCMSPMNQDDKEEEQEEWASILEQEALHVYQSQTQTQETHPSAKPQTQQQQQQQPAQGIRIVPRQGHVAIFAFCLPETGRVDARSWHTGEALLSGEEKHVLTYFFERKENQTVQQALQPLLDRYGLTTRQTL